MTVVTDPAPQNVSIAGDSNRVLQVDKLYAGPTYVQQGDPRQAFFEVQLATLRQPAMPANLAELAEHARRHGVALLGGTYDDKPTLARQVARHLAEERRWLEGGEVPALPVLEWSGHTDYGDLLRGVEQQEQPSVLLVPGVQPQDVGYDLKRLRTTAVHGGHLVVATTERGLETWRVDSAAAACWYALEPEGLFGADALTLALSTALEEVRGTLPPGALDLDARPGPALAGVPLAELAAHLQTPGNVEVFVQQLAAAGPAAPLDAERIMARVQGAASGKHRVERWFHGALGPDEQLLALSLALFDDLYDDQFFTALERWVEHLRARHNPRQRSFDYADLDTVRTFVTQVEGADATRYTSRWPGQRSMLLHAAWRTHRRAVLGALPVLTELARQSAPDRGENDELYGSFERRELVRDAIAGALSDIGLISRAGVQNALLQLAADPDSVVQSVAARAVAQWRESGAHAQLFETLKGWQQDARLEGLIQDILQGRQQERPAGPMEYVRATLAMAVAFASRYDAPGQLHPDLLELVERLSEDRNRMVRDRFGRFTLQIVAAFHLRQLRPLLQRMMEDEGLIPYVGAALAYAYRTNPDDVVETLNEWHRATAETRADTLDPRTLAPRDRTLLGLAFAYGEIDYTGGGPVAAEQGFRWLQHFLATERHPRVRAAAMVAISMQARRHFAQVEPLMQSLIGEVMKEEHGRVVRVLTGIYREQRAAQEGGTVQRTINGTRVWLWADGARPRTEVEEALLRWLCDPRTPAAQQVAVQAFVAFAEALDRAAGEEIGRYQEERRRIALEDAAARVSSTLAPTALEPEWYTGTFVPWLATRDDPRYAPVVRGLLPEALAQDAAKGPVLQWVIERWQLEPGDAAVVARRLRSALSWHATAWMLFPTAALLLILLLVNLF